MTALSLVAAGVRGGERVLNTGLLHLASKPKCLVPTREALGVVSTCQGGTSSSNHPQG